MPEAKSAFSGKSAVRDREPENEKAVQGDKSRGKKRLHLLMVITDPNKVSIHYLH